MSTKKETLQALQALYDATRELTVKAEIHQKLEWCAKTIAESLQTHMPEDKEDDTDGEQSAA